MAQFPPPPTAARRAAERIPPAAARRRRPPAPDRAGAQPRHRRGRGGGRGNLRLARASRRGRAQPADRGRNWLVAYNRAGGISAARPPIRGAPSAYAARRPWGRVINLTVLLVIGVVLLGEAATRLFDPPADPGRDHARSSASSPMAGDIAAAWVLRKENGRERARRLPAPLIADALATLGVIPRRARGAAVGRALGRPGDHGRRSRSTSSSTPARRCAARWRS